MSESNLEPADAESSGMSAQNPNAGEMKYTRISYIRAGGLGALTSIPVMALGSLAEGIAGLTFTPFDLFDGLARVLPGDILTFGIDSLVAVITALNIGPTSEVAKIAERSMALVMFVAIGAAFGIVLQWLGRDDPRQLSGHGVRTGALLAGSFWLVSVAVGFSQTSVWWVGLWFALLYVSWGWSLGWLIQRAGPALAEDPNSSLSRRDFVTLLGGSVATISIGSWAGASLFGKGSPPAPVQVEILDTSALVDSPTAEALAARINVAPGTRLEITPNADFYRIDISTRRPRLAAETWRLELTGVVDRPLSLTLEEIRAMPSLSYHHTLSCISNRVGGDLISTTRWTGVLVRDGVETAGMRTTAEEI